MAWQSPYRGEESPVGALSPKTREWISRGAMFVVGVVLLYLGVGGLAGMAELHAAAASQPAYGTNLFGQPRRQGTPLLPWVGSLFFLVLGVITIVAALVPVAKMQAAFERFGRRPPTTGDRGPDADDLRRWWWWS